jgi:pyruvate carboxylase subunit B
VPAPLPGVVLKAPVQVGDEVAVGQALVVLETMKMSNEIIVERAGRVSAAHVQAGDQVGYGAPLVDLEARP